MTAVNPYNWNQKIERIKIVNEANNKSDNNRGINERKMSEGIKMVLIFHSELHSSFVFNEIIYSIKIRKYRIENYHIEVIIWNYQRTSPYYICYIINKKSKGTMMLNSAHTTSLTGLTHFISLNEIYLQ